MNIVDKRNATDVVFSDLKVGELFVIHTDDVLYLKISSKKIDEHCNSEHIASNVVDLVNYDLHTIGPQVVVKPIHNATLVLK